MPDNDNHSHPEGFNYLLDYYHNGTLSDKELESFSKIIEANPELAEKVLDSVEFENKFLVNQLSSFGPP